MALPSISAGPEGLQQLLSLGDPTAPQAFEAKGNVPMFALCHLAERFYICQKRASYLVSATESGFATSMLQKSYLPRRLFQLLVPVLQSNLDTPAVCKPNVAFSKDTNKRRPESHTWHHKQFSAEGSNLNDNPTRF